MDDDQVNAALTEIAASLHADDPSLAPRLRRIRRTYKARVALVVAALTAAAILLAAGLATTSGTIWYAGAAALLAAFAFAPRDEAAVGGTATADAAPVDEWDEVLWIAGTWSTVVDELRTANGLDPWCRTLRPIARTRTHDGTVIAVGQCRPFTLHVSRRWFADGLRWRADAGGPVLEGHIRMQPTVTGTHVQIWIHAEARRCKHSRRALRTTRREAKSALRRWASTHPTNT